ncbi:MAG TPA: adenylate/guanylate cyclase domain-containing protein [Candidatus Dormibacteraeota bacterium]|nr:adenylate/guanylate cyclase domain-containing protein [Candidatus Dormibacteraeota bacterium]
MANLSEKARAELPDSAFAYIDSKGRRRLPINDEGHVRNALSRFNQVAFESEAARDQARTRLLKAAKKYGIVPVGFITGQVVNVRARAELAARESEASSLPRGVVTFLFSDIEDSTGLTHRLGSRYARLLAETRSQLRAAVRSAGGQVVDIRADELFAVFKGAPAALEAAIAIQRATLADGARTETERVRIRIGLHTGRPTLTDTGYVGLAVSTAARVCAAARGGQIVMSAATHGATHPSSPRGVTFNDLGVQQLKGLPEPQRLFQVEVETSGFQARM